MQSRLQYLTAMIIFGSVGIFVRYIDLSSSEIVLIRAFLGSLFLLTILVLLKKKLSLSLLKANGIVLVLSSIALGGNWIFLFQAFKHTTIANATLSYYFAPIIVLVLSPFILKEKLSKKKLICIFIAMIGMFFIIGNGTVSTSGVSDIVGIGYGLLAACLYASVILLNKFIKNMDGMHTTFVQLSLATLFLAPYVFMTEGFNFMSLPEGSLPFILIIGFVHTGIAYILFFSGIKKLNGQSIAVLSYADPITALFLSVFLLMEPMTYIQMIGGVLLLGATFISEYERKQPGVKEVTS